MKSPPPSTSEVQQSVVLTTDAFLALPAHKKNRLVAEALGWTFEISIIGRGGSGNEIKEIRATGPGNKPWKVSLLFLPNYCIDLTTIWAVLPGHRSLVREAVLNETTAHVMLNGDEQANATVNGDAPAAALCLAFLKAKKVVA